MRYFVVAALLAALAFLGGERVQAAPSRAITQVDAKIEIVWPHGARAVTATDLVNITTYLFEPDTLTSVPCDFNPTVRLWQALNNQPAANIAVAERRFVTERGFTYPVWDFNNINVSAARNPANKMYFYATVDGVSTFFNIWSHAADARTYNPDPLNPAGAAGIPTEVDARIQIVWPHNGQGRPAPVNQATRASVQVALFWRGSGQSVGRAFNQPVNLFKSLNNNPNALVGAGIKRIVTENGVPYPVWEFNDVDVSAVRNPANKAYFRALVGNTRTFSTIWAHGADARTLFPQPDVVQGGGCRARPTG